MEKIRLGIVGYGNLGRGVEKAISINDDMELVGIFSRRNPDSVDSKTNVYSIDKILDFKDKIDVMLLCGGSANDLGDQGPEISRHFNTVDSFDTHAKIPEYFESINNSSKEGKNLALISTGWDPGLFSLNRLLGQAILPRGEEYTFWGKGVSQGHSDAVRRIQGVKHCVQYTVPNPEALETVRRGKSLDMKANERHDRVCYVVVDKDGDEKFIEETIITMPNYFADYDTTVNFISEEEFKREHTGMPHGGSVFRCGKTGENTSQIIEFKLDLGSNPEFTSSVLVAYSRAIYKLSKEGKEGAVTVFDIPFGYLSPKSPEDLRKELL